MARDTGSLMPPMHILNAPTGLMQKLGYGSGYVYDHATEEGFSGQNYFPDGVPRREFYRPTERGFEREIRKRLDYWDKLRQRGCGRRRMSGVSTVTVRPEDGVRPARPLVQAALSGPQPRPARKAAAHRADPGRRQARPRRRPGRAGPGDPGAAACPRRLPTAAAEPANAARPAAGCRAAARRRAVSRRLGAGPQQARRSRGAGRHQHRAPCRCAARRAALRSRPNGPASCTGSTRTPRACC